MFSSYELTRNLCKISQVTMCTGIRIQHIIMFVILNFIIINSFTTQLHPVDMKQ